MHYILSKLENVICFMHVGKFFIGFFCSSFSLFLFLKLVSALVSYLQIKCSPIYFNVTNYQYCHVFNLAAYLILIKIVLFLF